jgi:hypothetical protein
MIFPAGPTKGFASNVFIISRLFADQHHHCALRTFAKDRLRRALVKVACLTIFRRLAHSRPARRVRRLCRTGKFFILLRHLYY